MSEEIKIFKMHFQLLKQGMEEGKGSHGSAGETPLSSLWSQEGCPEIHCWLGGALWSGRELNVPLCPCNSPGKNSGMGCHSFLQGIFPTQGSNPSLLHRRQILYPLSRQGGLNVDQCPINVG